LLNFGFERMAAAVSDPVFYSVTCARFCDDGQDLLGKVRQNWFREKIAQRGEISSEEFGADLSAKYHLADHHFLWKMESSGEIFQKAIPQKNGWAVISWDPSGSVRSKTTFNEQQQWERTAYYAGDFERPQVVLTPSQEGISMLEYDRRIQKYHKKNLYPIKLEEGTARRSLVDTVAGSPQVIACTQDGVFGYETREELERREAVERDFSKGDYSEEPDWKPVKMEPIDFQFVPNDHALDPVQPAEKEHLEEKTAPLTVEQTIGQEDGDGQDEDEDVIVEAVPPKESAAIEIVDLEEEKIKTLSEEKENIETAAKKPEEESKEHLPKTKDQETQPEKKQELPTKEAEPEIAEMIPAKRIVVSANEDYRYFGRVIDGLRQGRGRTAMENGDTAYEGNYRDDKRDGFGTYYYRSGKICYVGSWKENLREGMGVSFSAKDGSVFVGRWKDNIPTGTGAAFDSEGNLTYSGMWENGKRCRQGTEYQNGVVRYEGSFQNDMWEGRGIQHLASGGKLSGNFKNGMADGVCEERGPKGQLLRTGVWRAGKFVSGVLYQDGHPIDLITEKK
jgi:antitoxin component YwqK of YwqJK toxin-antitoxin module